MKVAIRWKGEELRYVDTGDLALNDTLTLKQFFDESEKKFYVLQQELQRKQEQIDKIIKELDTVKLQNIEVVKGLISR